MHGHYRVVGLNNMLALSQSMSYPLRRAVTTYHWRPINYLCAWHKGLELT
ncbi:hypothetical protein JYB87_00845 [Shewanella avicenniae]|uniref:Uncharacterized protein n=1 Tax=Shewanella avicenniae TaxID=2814294 RepID=A0ABX7QR00_9GAMM|nr:hypothetical protein [Shewanella avicenniae]QSX33834.1 hypothetical protein JYB87_00845 [Shewanella avicenniae]